MIHTNASEYGVGAVLSKLQSESPYCWSSLGSDDDSTEIVIAYTWKHLNDA